MIMAIRGGLKCLQQEENCKHRFENVFALLVAPNRAKLTLMVARKPMIFCSLSQFTDNSMVHDTSHEPKSKHLSIHA